MTTSRIIYDVTQTIDFKMDRNGLQVIPEQKYSRNVSSGLIEQINFYGIEKYETMIYFSSATYQKLYSWWWNWARHGNTFAFAEDDTKAGATTLDDAAVSGQEVIPLTSTSSFVIGDECVVVSTGFSRREIITIGDIDAGISIDAVNDLTVDFVSGDSCRHLGYYPLLMTDMKEFPKPDRTGISVETSDHYYKMKLKFIESYSDGYLDADDGVLSL